MLTKFNDSNDMNTVASDAIHSYIKDGYRIDAKESVIDREKDKDCTFKAVLKKDVDGIECKTTIMLYDNGDDKNKHCTYRKVETVGDTKWSEETRTFSYSCSKSNDKSSLNTDDKEYKVKDFNDEFVDSYSKKCDKHVKQLVDNCAFSRFNRLSDVIKQNNNSDTDSKNDNNHGDHKKDIKNKINTAPLQENDKTTKNDEDDLEDSLVKLIRFIFGN